MIRITNEDFVALGRLVATRVLRTALHDQLYAEARRARESKEKLARFKRYVHERLDKAGVPQDPPSPHQVTGCRVGGRLDYLMAKIDELESDLAESVESEAALLETLRTLLGASESESGDGYAKAAAGARAAIAKATGGEPASEERLHRLLDSSKAFTREAAAIGRSVATGERAAISDPEAEGK